MVQIRKVLVVDDSPAFIKQLSRVFEESGRYQVTGWASSGEEALQFLARERVDVVCLDLIMPGMGGLGALAKIRADYPRIAVVVISSVGSVADKVHECLKLGAKCVVSKPVDRERLLSLLDAI